MTFLSETSRSEKLYELFSHKICSCVLVTLQANCVFLTLHVFSWDPNLGKLCKKKSCQETKYRIVGLENWIYFTWILLLLTRLFTQVDISLRMLRAGKHVLQGNDCFESKLVLHGWFASFSLTEKKLVERAKHLLSQYPLHCFLIHW